MKKIAIIGAGFSGLGACYHLLRSGAQITLFDGKGVGGGASGIASGLLHPYPGEVARLSWKGEEALAETMKLLELVGPEVYKETGILKLALSEKQKVAFKLRAKEREDVEWWDAEKCHTFAPGTHYLPGIFIRSGITVHASLYLEGLCRICEEHGAHFEKKHVSLADLTAFDQVVIAAGGGIRTFEEEKDLDLKYNKGQILVCQRPSYMKKDVSISGKGYIAMSEQKKRCYLGSTYERGTLTEEPCLGTATDLILEQAGQYMADMSSFKVEGCLSGVRVVSRKSYHPIIKQLSEKLFVITAMGSRGLLYHSYMGKALTHLMAQEALV